MHLTLRLTNENYIDLDVNISKRRITFLSGVPDTELKDLMELADDYNITFSFPITDDVINPDDNSIIESEASLTDALILICTLMQITVSEY